MKNINKILVFLAIVLGASSCIDKDFDTPELKKEFTTLESNSSIMDLKAEANGDFKLVEEDLIVEGVVISDDENGNFYKSIIIQDTRENEIGGIQIKIEMSGLYNYFKPKDKVIIKCKGLMLGLYGGQVQLGGGKYKDGNEYKLSGISKHLISKHIFIKEQNVEPKVHELADFTNFQDKYLFTLVKFDNVQFINEDKNKNWAEKVDPQKSFNFGERTLEDQNGNNLLVLTSNYSKFSFEKLPVYSGSILGVLGKHKTNFQLLVRNTDDAKDMTKPRF